MSSRQIINVDSTVETTALDAGDVANAAIMEFAVSGYGIGKVVGLTIVDPDHNTAANLAGKLWLFTSSVTIAAKDAAHSVSDADMLKCIGWVTVAAGNCLLTAANTMASVQLSAPLPFDLGASTSLFGVYVVDATPTFAGGTLRFSLAIA
jgi:hypothetical protein